MRTKESVINEFLAGSTCGRRKKEIVWESKCKRYVLVTKRGHAEYIDRCTGTGYCPSHTALVDMHSDVPIRYMSAGILMSRHGRLTKTVMNEFKLKVELLGGEV